MPAKRTRQTKEYKLEAVRLATTSGKSVAAVAKDLGIPAESLYRWKREFEAEQSDAFRGNGVLRSADDELARLRRELKRVTEERDFLKKTAAYFAKESK